MACDRQSRQLDDASLVAAQAAVARALLATRGREPCVQRLPFFVARTRKNYNLGDELNLDIGAALLNVSRAALNITGPWLNLW